MTTNEDYKQSERYQEILILKPDVEIYYNNDAGPWWYSVQIWGTDEWIDSFDTLEEAEEFCKENGFRIFE